ncbi:hypothetical protein HOG17_03320 [Candidatus Peregrinibacteria bacterium]|jgi:hypothetical protein|nr:hypothetical protein [Candidatus Peregrinibacteria bacterium]MBT4148236.1 hypothetical protein [Candidatus Peregrinibacteria bacterium]MBT4455874.1 hypothetical protein [Candidatus Peregrinibacteria bacterium]
MFKKYLNSILSQSLFKESRLCNFAPPPDPDVPAPAAEDPEPVAPAEPETAPEAEVKRAEVRGRTKAELATKKGQTERDIFKDKIDRKIQRLKRLDLLELSRKRREYDIDPESLEHQSEKQLTHTMDVLQNQLGFLTNTEANWLKGHLSYAYDPEIWKNKERNDLRSLYQFPDGKLNKIAEDSGKGGRGGQMFLIAYTYLSTVKDLLRQSRDSHGLIDENMRESDRDGVFVTATDKVQEIGGKMMDAVEQRDYPEIAKYALAGWLFYKVYKNFAASSSEGAKSLKKFALYGGALYCGLSIFAPEYLKELKGKGVNADIKGTAFENLDSLLSRNPSAYEKGIEVGLMASLANAPVKEIFGSITPTSSFYDPQASASQIIHLDNPAFSGFLPADVVNARPFPGKKAPFSAMEKLYVKTSEQLFKSVQGLKRMYEENVYPTEGVTFEEKFLSEKSQDYTIHDLVYQLSAFTPNYKEQFWTSKLLHKARLDLTGPTGVFKDIDGMIIPNAAPAQALLNATVRGYPVSIRINETPTGREYEFYLPPDDGKGATSVGKYKLGDKDSLCRRDVVEAINKRANKMLRSVTTADKKLGITWDEHLGIWSGTILTSYVEKFKIDPTTISVLVEFTPDGRKAIMTSDGSKSVIVIDEIMALDYEHAPLVINKVINQNGKGGNDDFTALRVFQNNGEVRFEDIQDSDEHFILHFPGERKLKVGFDGANDRFYIVDKDEEKALVRSLTFRKEYVESLDRRKNSPFKVFDKMKDYVPDMPEGHVLYFFKELGTWVTDAKISDIAAGVDGDCVNGTVPEYFTAMLIDSKKQALKYKLMWEMEKADTLGGVNDARLNIQKTLDEMDGLYETVIRKAEPKNRSHWERNEYLMKVIQPLRSAGTQSEEYAYATNRFETHMLSELDLKGSDWSENLHNVAGKLLGTFYYFTSHLDESKLDEYSTEDQKKYSNLRARYFQYVEDEVIDQSRSLLKEGRSSENIPDWPGLFDIKLFADEWRGKSDAPIDVEDTREKLSMAELSESENGRTELEDKLFKSYQKVISDLRTDLSTTSGGGLDWAEVNVFAAEYFGFKSDVDIDALAETHSPDVLLPNEERPVYMDALALNYGTKKRSQQITQIPAYAERFRAKIFGDDRFLREGGTWKDIKDWYRINRPHHRWMP